MTRGSLLSCDQSVALGGLMLRFQGDFYGHRDPASLHRLASDEASRYQSRSNEQPNYGNAMGGAPVSCCDARAQGQNSWLH
jgi:hypothetical protein